MRALPGRIPAPAGAVERIFRVFGRSMLNAELMEEVNTYSTADTSPD
jgi:hypothetical protein